MTRQSYYMNQKGFSLMELMVVLVLMSIMAGLVFASFTSLGSELEQQASKLATVIRTIDDVSAARKQLLELKFDFEERTIGWVGPDGSMKKDEFDMLDSLEALSIGRVDEGQINVIFEPSRTTESMTVHFKSEDKMMSVKYNPLARRTKLIGPTDIP